MAQQIVVTIVLARPAGPTGRAAAPWCAARDLLRFRLRRHGGGRAFLPLRPHQDRPERRRGQPQARCWRSQAAALPLLWLTSSLRRLGGRRRFGSGAAAAFCWSICSWRSLVQILRYALLEAGTPSGNTGLRHQAAFLLGVEEVEQVTRVETEMHRHRSQPARCKALWQQRCDQTLRAAHDQSLTQLLANGAQGLQGFGARTQLDGSFAHHCATVEHFRSGGGVIGAPKPTRASNRRAVCRKVEAARWPGSSAASMFG